MLLCLGVSFRIQSSIPCRVATRNMEKVGRFSKDPSQRIVWQKAQARAALAMDRNTLRCSPGTSLSISDRNLRLTMKRGQIGHGKVQSHWKSTQDRSKNPHNEISLHWLPKITPNQRTTAITEDANKTDACRR